MTCLVGHWQINIEAFSNASVDIRSRYRPVKYVGKVILSDIRMDIVSKNTKPKPMFRGMYQTGSCSLSAGLVQRNGLSMSIQGDNGTTSRAFQSWSN